MYEDQPDVPWFEEVGLSGQSPRDAALARMKGRWSDAAKAKEQIAVTHAPPDEYDPTANFQGLAHVDEQRAQEVAAAQAAFDARDRGEPVPPQMSAADLSAMASQESLVGAQRAASENDKSWMNVKSKRPTYEATKQYTDTMGQLLPEQQQLGEGVTDAKVLEARQNAEALDDFANKTNEHLVDAEARNFAQSEEMRAEEQATRESIEALEEAKQVLAHEPDVDVDRWWESRSSGQRFRAVLGGMLAGIGGLDPMGNINRAIAKDIDEQKMAYAKRKDLFDASNTVASQRQNLYGQMRARVGDDRQAAATLDVARRQQALAELERKQAEHGIPVLAAEGEAFKNELRQQIAKGEADIQKMAALNPKYRYRKVSTIGKSQRALNDKLIAQGVKDQSAFKGKALDQIGKGELQQSDQANKMQLEGVRQEGKRGAAVAAEHAKGEVDIKKATDEWGAVETLVSDFLKKNPGNIHGSGMPGTGTQNQRAATRNFKNALNLLMTNGFTGATATEVQDSKINEIIEGGMFEITDDAFRSRMENVLNIASAKRRYHQNRLGSENSRVSEASELSTFTPE